MLSLKFSSNFLKFPKKLHKISTDLYTKCIQKVVRYFFETPKTFLKIFSFFQSVTRIFLTFNISAKFLPSFLKTIAKFFCTPKFHQKLRNINICTPVYLHIFFQNFSTSDNNSKLHHNVSRAPSRKLEVFWKFH